MGILIAGVSPHPPMLIPEIGGREIDKIRRTAEALKKLSAEIASRQPETVVFITPHGPMFQEAPAVLADEELAGDFSAFRAPGVILRAQNDLELVQALAGESRKEEIEVILLRRGEQDFLREEISLDHGVTVPLYFMQEAGTAQRCVAITFAPLSFDALFRFGQALQRAISVVDRKAAIVASADLSHRLTRSAPAGYHPRGREYDDLVVESLTHYQVEKLLSIDKELVSDAGECGLRSLLILLGSLSGLPVQSQLLSYEGPFGVGYPVALFTLPAQHTGPDKRVSGDG
ncbi:MAG: AmmeMemoRadiSam system protein B [Firmicutes bacterium]|nr:AmmeMemoRadiSam system protein B [Bacillota bacterium]